MGEKIYFIISAIILILLILFWPIYFFTVSLFGIVPQEIGQLVIFVIIELFLVGVLVVLWEFYKRQYKK